MLYDRHTPYLWRLALRLCAGDAARAEDIVHDAWIRAAERFATFGARSALRTWLAGFVVNVVREMRREHERDALLSDDVTAQGSGEDRAVARIDLDRALARLPAGFRQVLVLHDVDGFTHEEIATMLGVEPGTSKSQLARARRRARALLEPDGAP